MTVVYLLLAIIPAFFIGWFIYAKDRNKESKGLLIKLFLGGVASCFVTFLISSLLQGINPNLIPSDGHTSNNIIILFFQVMLGIALVEEFSKWILTYVIGYRNKEFDEIYDAIVYCAFVALGFATFENILYVFVMENQLTTALLRAVTAVPGHVVDAIVMGYFLGLAKKSDVYKTGDKTKYIILSIVMPMLSHGIYDFLIMTGSLILVVIWFIFVILMYVFAISKVNKISKSGERLYNYPTCPNCHYYVDGRFCTNCGTKLEMINQVLSPTNNQPMYYYQPQDGQVNNNIYQQPIPNTQVVNNYQNVGSSYCPNCGNIVNTPFCTHCGMKKQ